MEKRTTTYGYTAMTFVFGARCKDGVVLIGNTLLPATKDYSYGHKIFSEFPGVVIACAGDT
jgi:20S proteasome alpha/beta subunit